MAVELAEQQARTTHQSPECVASSRVFAEILLRALRGGDKATILNPAIAYTADLPMKVANVVLGQSYRRKAREAIRGTGYVIDCLEAALWAFDTTTSYRECVLAAANLGEDADTTAAVAGQLAGAFYGGSGIPAEWVEMLTHEKMIRLMACSLHTESRRHAVPA
jgi:ADP-ribosyl-[dinitrogen reductase] hydrolase